MTEQTEVKSEKTPGDLKREEIARSIGVGWQFYRNYGVRLKEPEGKSISTLLELDKKTGKIADWQAEQLAFNDNGDELLFDQARAAYIKPNPKQV